MLEDNQIRRAERISYIASTVAVILTIVMTGTNHANEANPFSLFIIQHAGFLSWAIFTPLAIAVMFRLARETTEGFTILGHEVAGDLRASRVASWLFCSALLADSIGNVIYTSVVGVPTVNWTTFAIPVLAVSVLSLTFAFRWEISEVFNYSSITNTTPFIRRTMAVVLAICMVTSTFAAVTIISPQSSPVGTSAAATETGPDLEMAYRTGGDALNVYHYDTGETESLGVSAYSVGGMGDFDGDGEVEVAYADTNDNLKTVDYSGNVRDLGEPAGKVGGMGDTDGDGDPEILYQEPSGDNKDVRLIDTNGDITDTGYSGNANPGAIADVDGDGTPGAIFINPSNSNLTIFEEGQGTTDLGVSGTYSGAAGDFDDDGDMEVFFGGNNDNAKHVDLNGNVHDTGVSGTYGMNTDAGDLDDDGVPETGLPTGSPGNVLVFQGGTTTEDTGHDGFYTGGIGDIDGDSVYPDEVSGTVVNQDGDPVSDATVVGYAAKYPSVSESRDKLTDFSNPLPPGWIDQGKAGVDLLGDSGFFSDKTSYVAAHGQDSLQNTAPWVDGADLSSPKIKHPANEPIILSAWDGTASGFGVNTCVPAPGGNEYDCQMPGEHKSDTTIVVERIDGSGDVQMRSEFETDETSGGGFGDPDQFHYTTAELQPGFYRFYEKGSGNKGLVHMVGDPTALIQQSAEDVEGQLTTQAKNVDDALNAGDLERVTTTTDSDGSFSLSVGSNSKMVTVQAIKAPDVLNTTPSSVDVETITSEYNTALTATDPTETQRTLLNSSVYFPSRTQVVEPPKNDVTIRMTELSSPPGANATALQDQIERLRDRLQNQSFSDLKGSLQEQLENVNRDRLEKLHGELDTIREQNDQLEQRYEDLLEKQLDTENPNLDVNLNDTSDAELRSRIQALQQTITELQSTVEAGPGEITSSTDTVTYRQRFGSPLENPEQVSVIADWSNGTSQVVSDDYISVNNDPENIAGFGGSEIVVEKFPIDSDDPKAVSFRVVGATDEGFAKKTKQVKNPTFSGELPSIQSISVNSLEPASNETVNLKVNPGEGSIQEVSDLTVFGPNGQQTGSPSVDGRTASFTTDAGTGVYSVRATLTTADGVSTTETLRLPVANTDTPRKPSIRAKESPIGAYAVVGDGLSNGDVNVENGGSSVTVLAELKDDADVPPRLHVYTESLSLASDADTTIRVVRGQNQESVGRHVRVTLHSQSVPDGSLIWRNDQPIPIDAESQYGTAKTTGRGLSIRTYTDGSGTVTVRTQTDPSFIDEAQFWIASNVNLDDLNPLMTSPAAATAPGSRTASATAETAS